VAPQSRIEAIGIHLPEKSVSTAELMDRIDPSLRFDLEEITGIQRRRVHSHADKLIEDSLRMAVLAAKRCLMKSRYCADDLDIIVSASISRGIDGTKCSFDPALALHIRNIIGAARAKFFDVANACAGMATGLMILDRMIATGAVRRGLVVSGEQITPIAETAVSEISQKYDPHFAALTVGDAGAAVLLDAEGVPGDRIDFVDMMTCAEFAELCIGMPSDRNQGMAMYMDNRSMHNEERYLEGISRLRDVLARRGSSFEAEGFDFIIHHQFAGPVIDVINLLMAREFAAPQPVNLNVLDQLGNTASTSLFVVLRQYLADGTIPSGAKALIVPSASGIVYGTISATLTEVGV
jgi:3-oxoacyl-[acyl-carrier-protein] synthase-3